MADIRPIFNSMTLTEKNTVPKSRLHGHSVWIGGSMNYSKNTFIKNDKGENTPLVDVPGIKTGFLTQILFGKERMIHTDCKEFAIKGLRDLLGEKLKGMTLAEMEKFIMRPINLEELSENAEVTDAKAAQVKESIAVLEATADFKKLDKAVQAAIIAALSVPK